MAAGKAKTRYLCSHRQCEKNGCVSEGSRAGWCGCYHTLEQQPGHVGTAGCHHNAREIDTLDNLDIRDAEDIMKLLKALKTVTTVLSDEQNPTVSLIVGLKHMIEQSMLPVEEDSTTVSMMMKAIFSNSSDRYSGPGDNHLRDCTALEPRFRSLPHLTEDQRQDVFQRVKEKAVQMHNQVLLSLSVTNSY